MAIQTLRPNSIVSDPNGPGGSSWLGGDINKIRDNSDATYATSNAFSGPAAFVVGMDNWTIPANAIILGLRARVRVKGTGGDAPGTPVQWGFDHAYGMQDAAGNRLSELETIILDTIQNHSGALRTTTPTGGAWTQAAINDIRWRGEMGPWASTASIFIYEAYIDIEYNYLSVPTLVTVPAQVREDVPVTWTFTDPDAGDTQVAYDAKIFRSDVVNGGGFNPASSSAVFTKGFTSSAAGSATLNANLSPGRYYVYIQTYDSGTNNPSNWVGSNEFRVVNSPLMIA